MTARTLGQQMPLRTGKKLHTRTTRGRTNRGISDKIAVTKVGVATVPIRLFRLDALVCFARIANQQGRVRNSQIRTNEPEGMDMATARKLVSCSSRL